MKVHDNFNNISKEELIFLLQEKHALVAQQAKQIQFLAEQILAYQLRQFASKSEKINPNQASLFDEAKLPPSEENILSQEEEITVLLINVKTKWVANLCLLNYYECHVYMIYPKKKKPVPVAAN